MHKLTPAELSEPDRKIVIPVAWFAKLPAETKQEVKDLLYGYIDQGNFTYSIYIVPGYLARQLEQISRRLG